MTRNPFGRTAYEAPRNRSSEEVVTKLARKRLERQA